MIIAMIAISAVVLAVCISVAFVRLRRQRTPSALRGNWWADFERQFRAYDREARRHRRAKRDDNPAKRPPTN
jgi:hypothetical protein